MLPVPKSRRIPKRFNLFFHKIECFSKSIIIALLLSSVAFGGTPRFAFVPNIDDGTVSEFVVNAATGQLLPNGYVTAGDHPRSFVNVGNFAYVANMDSGDISAYSLSQTTGKLQPLTNPSFLAPGQPYALIAHPNKQFLYAVDGLGGRVYAYRIATDGSLQQISTISAGTSPRFLAITGSGNFLYVANFLSNNVTAYQVNSVTGLLTVVAMTGPIFCTKWIVSVTPC
jgi:6-phosphogluconolactonase (cycloisomerase 2 family)